MHTTLATRAWRRFRRRAPLHGLRWLYAWNCTGLLCALYHRRAFPQGGCWHTSACLPPPVVCLSSCRRLACRTCWPTFLHTMPRCAPPRTHSALGNQLLLKEVRSSGFKPLQAVLRHTQCCVCVLWRTVPIEQMVGGVVSDGPRIG